MLLTGNIDDRVWMVIDNEVVAGRLLEIFPNDDSLASGHRVNVKYSDTSRGYIRGNFAEHVFAENDYEAARTMAKSFSDEPERSSVRRRRR